ncbi:MAG: STAS domain-containing protein [Sedimentisphaerales bacterium]|nr:STAS domain-containing protein [Sedimentisphaerales bacterium]
MQVVINNEGAVTLVKPMGALLSGELEELDKALQGFCQNWTKRIILNLSETNCIDSAGLELIKRHHRQMKDRGLRLKVCSMNKLVGKILDLTRLSRRFEIYPDTTSAVRSFL